MTDDTPPTVETYHEIDRDTGTQRTYRTVTVTDAAGTEFEHTFELLADGRRRYCSDGDPSQAALDALDAWEDAHAEPGELGADSGVICEHCGEDTYRKILGIDEDTDHLDGKEQFSCPSCGDGIYLDTDADDEVDA